MEEHAGNSAKSTPRLKGTLFNYSYPKIIQQILHINLKHSLEVQVYVCKAM